ncbi:SSI family serine proteinase inhibitor [Streptomyces sp. NPDC006134]|uniref:SSI family serine proteinase inhibitor n=1 Tax=Streptomyces sp. NPDC006134 TaxID=3154467 RepID=UPI0033D05481
MRNTAHRATTLGHTAATVFGPLTGAALAAPGHTPASLHAPSAPVLTVGRGESAATATPLRAVTLTCAPRPSGTHPVPGPACAGLRAADGNPDALTAGDDVLRTKEYAPAVVAVVTVDGVWQGRRVSSERTFADECVQHAHGAGVFAF